MGKDKTPTTTTTAPDFNAVLNGIKQLSGSSPLGGIVGSTGGTSMPGVPTSQGGDVVTWQSAGQNSGLTLTPDMEKLLTTATGGDKQITYNAAVQLLHMAAADRPLLVEIQNDLKSAGFIPASQKVAFGTLDKNTLNGWKQLITDSVGTSTPISHLLTMNNAVAKYIPETYALQSKYQTALNAAASVQAPMLTMTDPNKIAQTFATAMESMGEGAPSKEQTAKFVTAFHNAEVSAVQDAYSTQKNDYMQGANTDLTQLQALQNGVPTPPNPTMPQPGQTGYGAATQPFVQPGAQDVYNRQLGSFDNTMSQGGPVTVAQKATPNLDAEAIAAAQKANPGQYYATGSTYLYGLLQRMLNGDMTLPTSASSPTSMTPAGGIVTSPIAGAP
jgi:hypothetical protein